MQPLIALACACIIAGALVEPAARPDVWTVAAVLVVVQFVLSLAGHRR